jgi:hypothetical protein
MPRGALPGLAGAVEGLPGIPLLLLCAPQQRVTLEALRVPPDECTRFLRGWKRLPAPQQRFYAIQQQLAHQNR